MPKFLSLVRLVCGSVAVLLFVLFSSQSFAFAPSAYTWSYPGVPASVKPTASESCIAFGIAVSPSWVYNGYTLLSETTAQCQYNAPNSNYYNVNRSSAATCPVNSTGTSSCTCDSGYQENSTATACEPVPVNACLATQGQTRTVNVTIGWSQSPTSLYSVAETVGGGVTLPAELSVDGCVWDSVDSGVSDSGWISTVPSANGLYRISQDKTYRQTAVQASGGGTAASNSPSLVNPTVAPPACPGSVGEIDGVTRCIIPSGVNIMKAVPVGVPSVVQPGNPVAGLKPPTGEGSGSDGAGRTPIAGNGSAAGGPAAAASGTPIYQGKQASSPAGTEQAACGAPGQPVCDVKISESGSLPNLAPNVYGDKVTAHKDAIDSNRSTIAGSSDKGFFSSWTIFFAAPALAACTPFVLPRDMGSIDPCPVVDGVRYVMGLIWALTGLLFSLRMIKQVV